METIYLKTVQSIMDTYKPAYPTEGSWDATLAYMLATPEEATIVHQLQNVLEVDGRFREPIRLVGDGTEDNPFMVRNGTHRLVAAYLSSHKEVVVREGYMSDQADINESSLVTDITFTLGQTLSEDEADGLFTTLRSFPLTSELWMTADMASGSYPALTLYWEEFPEALHHEAVSEAVRATLARAYPTLEVESIITFVEAWEDDRDEDEEALWASIGD